MMQIDLVEFDCYQFGDVVGEGCCIVVDQYCGVESSIVWCVDCGVEFFWLFDVLGEWWSQDVVVLLFMGEGEGFGVGCCLVQVDLEVVGFCVFGGVVFVDDVLQY